MLTLMHSLCTCTAGKTRASVSPVACIMTADSQQTAEEDASQRVYYLDELRQPFTRSCDIVQPCICLRLEVSRWRVEMAGNISNHMRWHSCADGGLNFVCLHETPCICRSRSEATHVQLRKCITVVRPTETLKPMGRIRFSSLAEANLLRRKFCGTS